MDNRSDKREKWYVVPFEHFLALSREYDRILSLSKSGISGLRGSHGLAKAVVDLEASKQKRKKTKLEKKQLENFKQMEILAKSEVKQDFPLLHIHTIIAIWGALEVLIDDLVLAWLLNKPETLGREVLAKIKIPFAKFEAFDNREDRIRFLIEELKRDLRSGYGPGVAGFDRLLEIIGLSGETEGEIKRTLIEFREIRNLFVHKAGIVDKRFLEICPWIKFTVGQKLQINYKEYLRYYKALVKYCTKLLLRIDVLLKNKKQDVN